MRYELILIDADGTIFDYDRAEEYALEKTMMFFNVEFNKDYYLGYYRHINKNIWDEFEKSIISIDDLKTERFKRLFKKIKLYLEPGEFSRKYLDFLGDASFLLEGAEDILIKLYNKYKLLLITNGLSEVQNKRIEGASLKKYFDALIISEEVGAAKPDTEIFEYAFNKVDYSNKDKTIIIGDSLKSDILGGNNFGIDTCWLNMEGKVNESNIKPVYEINSLEEFINIL
jgi:2-haloacid dehalogenase